MRVTLNDFMTFADYQTRKMTVTNVSCCFSNLAFRIFDKICMSVLLCTYM